MLRNRTFVLLLAMAMLALPASSFAQSAGDDQYQDPLAGQGGGGHSGGSGGGHSGGGTNTGPSSGSSGNSSGSGTAPATQTSPAGSSSTAGSASTGSSAQATSAQAANGQLPRTGFDVIVTIELGLAMLLTGIVSQRLIALRDRRSS